MQLRGRISVVPGGQDSPAGSGIAEDDDPGRDGGRCSDQEPADGDQECADQHGDFRALFGHGFCLS